MKAVIFTLGCKVNEVESSYMLASLRANGWEVSDKLGYADLYILNTCAVTREAEKKSRQLIARAKKYNPYAKIYVCGCASQKNAPPFFEKGAEYVAGAADKMDVLNKIYSTFGGEPYTGYPEQVKTRAFIKIQDGCNNFCTYCIIPYLRGREVSRPISSILDEISKTDCPEVVLTGINVSSYKVEEGGLISLVRALKNVKKRIRFSSLECSVITDELLSALGGLYDFAPHFHLSLQSGSSRVLKDMNRHYTREEFLMKCRLIYSHFPAAAITTDLISGFPTETEEDFKLTLSIIEEAGIARVHAFSFSPREGTAAFKLKDLPAEVKSARISALISAGEEAESKYVSRFLGKTLYFIAEEFHGGYTTGYTENYIKTYINTKLKSGKKYAVKLTSRLFDGALAEILYEV